MTHRSPVFGMSGRRLGARAAALVSCLLAGACVPVGYGPGTGATSELRGVDFVPTPDVPLYCYRVLAGVDCYGTVAPLPPNRLILPYPPDHDL